MSVLKSLLKFILVNSFPAFCIYAGKSTNITDVLIKLNWIDSSDTATYQNYFFLTGSFVAIIFNGIYQLNEIKLKAKLSAYNEINKLNLNLIKAKLCDDLNVENDLKIRVFKVKKRWFSSKTRIVNFVIPGITDKILGKNVLTFQHVKIESGNVIQGVVGLCIEHKKVGVDYNAKNTHLYSLTDEQKALIGDVIFCCAAPIFKNNKIKYIISLDSNCIKINETTYDRNATEDIIISSLKRFCATFDEFVL